VQCVDGPAGHTTHVILNPINQQITHVVVRPDGLFANADFLVPVEAIIDAEPDRVRLRYTKDELAQRPVFTQVEFLPYTEGPSVLSWPYTAPLEPMPVTHKRVPPGELAVRRSDRVEATDGPIGRVDEFLVDPQNSAITHLIMREGNLWGRREVTIPVANISRIEAGAVYLSMSKKEVAALPSVPVRHG
jgi:hypothetical protein